MKTIGALGVNKAWSCLAVKVKLNLGLSEVSCWARSLLAVGCPSITLTRGSNSASPGSLSICRGVVRHPHCSDFQRHFLEVVGGLWREVMCSTVAKG